MDLSQWVPPPRPEAAAMQGRWVRLEPLAADAHAADLHRAFSAEDRIWDYLSYGPFASAASYHRWVREAEAGTDPLFFALRDAGTGHCGGVAAFLRIQPEAGSIEVGHICLAPELQRNHAATEAIALMMGWAFGAGYRRFEWKCNARNIASRRAAQRLGFSFEGVHRQAAVVKGQSRDTAWFSVIDSEWPGLAEAFRLWLSPGNFDAGGRQKERLSDLTALVRSQADPALSPGAGARPG
jgi:RimJ/RimL family protein N-acetyltransferase